MDYTTEEIGRVLGSQIYIYNSPDEIPALPPKGVNDVFIDINLGKVYQWDGTEWKYKFPIPNDSRIVDIVDELTALGARLSDAESARVVAENSRVGAEQSRVAAETERGGNEATRQSNETARQGAETARASAETSRADAESIREDAETERETAEGNRAIAETARADSESSRASAETARATAESGRASAEQARVNAESARATAEGQRAAAETTRDNAESARASAETARQTNESTRQSQEQTRQSQEIARQTAEGSRSGAEQTRAQNEIERQVSESNRNDAEGLRVQAENTRAENDATWNQHEQTRQANEAQRVLAEQARVEAEAGRQAELDSKITYGSGWFDGSGGVASADYANELISKTGLTVNDDPMSFGVVGGAQKSAVGDGNASLNKLVCVDVVRNQLAKALNSTNWSASSSSASYNDGVATFTASAKGGMIYTQNIPFYKHTYVAVATVKLTTASTDVYLRVQGVNRVATESTTNWQTLIFAYTSTLENNSSIGIRDERESGFDAIQVKDVCFIDLTQRYGSNDVVNAIIGNDASTQVAKLLAFDPEILNDTDYDEGTLVPSKTAKLKAVGYNQYSANTFPAYSYDWATHPAFADALNPVRLLGNKQYHITGTNASANQVVRVRVFDLNGNLVTSDVNFVGHGMRYVSDFSAFCGDTYTTTTNLKITLPFDGYIDITTPAVTNNPCINLVLDGSSVGFKPYNANPVTLPNYEGHGVLTVVDGKVVADGDELYPDGNSKKRYETYTFTGNEKWSKSGQAYQSNIVGVSNKIKAPSSTSRIANIRCDSLIATSANNLYSNGNTLSGIAVGTNGNIWVGAVDYANVSSLTGKTICFEFATEEDITTPVFQPTFPVEQGGTLQFLDEDDNPIAGLQGSEVFYQKNIKAYVEALGEATNWDPERIKRLGNLSLTPEYVDITLDPSPTGAYARAQVYNATFTIVISAALTGTANGTITFQDSEVDLSNFQTEPAKAIYDMDGKKVSEAPTTADCNIASFVGRSKSGTVLWSLLHSGVNKVKIRIEEAVPLDSEGNGKIDCRASLIL